MNLKKLLKLFFLLLLLFTFKTEVAFSHGGDDHDHGHEEKSNANATSNSEYLIKTFDDEKIEVLLKYKDLKASQHSHLNFFITDFHSNKPISDLTGSLIFFNEKEKIESKLVKTDIDGMYLSEIEAPKAGEYNLNLKIKNKELKEKIRFEELEVSSAVSKDVITLDKNIFFSPENIGLVSLFLFFFIIYYYNSRIGLALAKK